MHLLLSLFFGIFSVAVVAQTKDTLPILKQVDSSFYSIKHSNSVCQASLRWSAIVEKYKIKGSDIASLVAILGEPESTDTIYHPRTQNYEDFYMYIMGTCRKYKQEAVFKVSLDLYAVEGKVVYYRIVCRSG